MKLITTILGVIVVIIILGVLAYVAHREGWLTLTDIDNFLTRAIQIVKEWINSVRSTT